MDRRLSGLRRKERKSITPQNGFGKTVLSSEYLYRLHIGFDRRSWTVRVRREVYGNRKKLMNRRHPTENTKSWAVNFPQTFAVGRQSVQITDKDTLVTTKISERLFKMFEPCSAAPIGRPVLFVQFVIAINPIEQISGQKQPTTRFAPIVLRHHELIDDSLAESILNG